MFSSKETETFQQYKNFKPAGLKNPYFLCFLNTLIQTFASSSQWQYFFKTVAAEHPVFTEFQNLISKINESFGGDSVLSTRALRKQLNCIGIELHASRQSDLREVYTQILDVLEKLIKQVSSFPFTAFSTYRYFPSHCIIEETIECPICKSKTSNVIQQSIFILNASSNSLKGALDDYFGPFTIESKCSKCETITSRIISRHIIFAPKSILFFLSRDFTYNGPLQTPFRYTPQCDMKQFCLVTPQAKPRDDHILKQTLDGFPSILHFSNETGIYSLTSVVFYDGNGNSGHYNCARIHREQLPPYSKQWVLANDSKISPLTIEEVLSQFKLCTLLHYELEINQSV